MILVVYNPKTFSFLSLPPTIKPVYILNNIKDPTYLRTVYQDIYVTMQMVLMVHHQVLFLQLSMPFWWQQVRNVSFHLSMCKTKQLMKFRIILFRYRSDPICLNIAICCSQVINKEVIHNKLVLT